MNQRDFSPITVRGCIAAALSLFLGCQSYAAPSDQQQVAAANNNFTFNLLQQLASEQPGSNVFISAYSAATDLQMLSVGAESNTKGEMEDALGIAGLPSLVLYEGNRALNSIINAKNPNYDLTTANAIWYRVGTPLVPSFVSVNRNYFRAKEEGLNFNSPNSAAIINAWASQATHGKINKIVQWPISSDVRLFLNNAVYFLGSWQNPFDTNLTAQGTFTLSGGGQAVVPLMHQTDFFGYREGSNYQVVRLPYKGNKLAMYVFLPNEGSTPQDLLNSMNGTWWGQARTSGFPQAQGMVALPKFNLNYTASLVPALQALGMESAFTQEANFSGLSPQPLSVADVKQQAVVQVDEKGTLAAAVTTITVIATVAPPPPSFEMIVNRPFLFFIQDEQAGSILFSGAVFNP